jgi:cysteine desulfurase
MRRALEEPRKLITTATEHASIAAVADWLEAANVEVVRLTGTNGRVSSQQVEASLADGASLVSIQWANSETGVLQPIEAVADVCRLAGVPLHVDAAQAVGRLPIDLQSCPIDYLTFSGHKLHAPQGVGVIFARDPDSLPPLLLGGGQEAGRRAGTENLPGIAGLRVACETRARHLPNAIAQMQKLRDRLEQGILASVPGVVVNAADSPRVCNTTNIRFPVDGQALVAQLSAAGIVCSQTSACSSQSPEPSRVLTAIGLSRDEAFASVRFSFSYLNTEQDVDVAVNAIAGICERLPSLG